MTKEEFKTLVLPSKGKLFRLAASLLSSREDAEDTLQDAFLKLWNMRDKLPEYKSVEALAVTMVKNMCLDKLRSYKHRKQDAAEIETMTIRTDFPDPGKKMELNESSATIHEIIQTLPDKQRTVLHLRDIEHYRYDEIEELTGLTRNAVRVNLSRARKAIREEYLKRTNYEHPEN